MNVFEDLVIELKEENLLERTVIELDRQKEAGDDPLDEHGMPGTSFALTDGSELEDNSADFDVAIPEPHQSADSAYVDHAETDESFTNEATDVEPVTPPVSASKKTGKEFFKKRAVSEVSGLQMVEHVLTAVEREYMKVMPKPFDDFNAKKALHTFVNIAAEPDSAEHKAAEHALMQETEAWGMALTERDRNVSVSNLRRYCENSRPALSSQALLALARFYRNSPCSESVRAKFDFVITRLFSRPAPNEKRDCLFKRSEMVGHIKTLYNEWSSIPLYAADDDESNVLLTGLSFDDLAAEAEAAANFDQLIASDFFGRLRLFKESISELFFAPTVTAAAIESNIRVGNTYVRLIDSERRKMDASSIESKYSDTDLQSVSEATGRTFDLTELGRQHEIEPDAGTEEDKSQPETHAASDSYNVVVPEAAPATTRSRLTAKLLESTRRVNRWLVITAIIMLFLTIGLYVWADFVVVEKISTVGVQQVDVQSTAYGEYMKTGRISGDTFYGLMLPTWDALSKEKRQEILQKVYDAGKEKGYKQVALINKEGKQAGFASATRLEVIMP